MKGTAEIKRPLSEEARLNLHRFIVEHRIMDRIRAHQAQQSKVQSKGA